MTSTLNNMFGKIATAAQQYDTLQRIQSICRGTDYAYNKIATIKLELITSFEKIRNFALHREQNRDS